MSRKITTTEGTGAPVGDGNVTVEYKGSLQQNNERVVFDQNTNFRFAVGAGHVIPCWDQQISQMKVGETATIVCPSTTAYGDQAVGPIPANSELTFEVTLKEKHT